MHEQRRSARALVLSFTQGERANTNTKTQPRALACRPNSHSSEHLSGQSQTSEGESALGTCMRGLDSQSLHEQTAHKMHLHKCPRLATLAGRYSCGCLPPLLLLLLLVAAAAAELTNAANTENKQHEQPARMANLTLKANNTSAGPPARQINSANSRRDGAKATAASPPPPPPPNNNNQSSRLISKYKLPSWFHFNTFKQLYGKRYPGGYVDELHKRIYLRTSLKVFEQRALYRSGRLDSLASVNELSDLTSEQLDQFRALRKNSSSTGGAARQPPNRQLPECCTYDQVYARIIGLLSAATSSNDSALSRALVDELEQKPLVESDARDEPNYDLEPPASKVKAAGNERPTAYVKSTRQENKASAAAAANIDDKRARTKMIERRHRADGDEEGAGSHRKGGAPDGDWRSAGAAKSNLAPGRPRHARPATSASLGSNRSTTSAGGKPAAGNTQQPLTGRGPAGAHSGPAEDEDERSAVELGVPREIEEAVRAQVAEQLSSSSPLGRELSKQMSAYFGRPVEIRAVPATGPKQTPQQQQQQQSALSTRTV